MSKNEMDLSARELEDLGEVMTVGAGNAVTRLYDEIGFRCNMDIPSVEILRLEQLTEKFSTDNVLAAAIFQEVFGELPSFILFLMRRKDAHDFVELILKKKEQSKAKDFSFTAQYILKDTGSILTNSFVEGINRFLKVKARLGMPDLSLGSWHEILQQAARKYKKSNQEIIAIHSNIQGAEIPIQGMFLYMLNLPAVSKLLRKIQEIEAA